MVGFPKFSTGQTVMVITTSRALEDLGEEADKHSWMELGLWVAPFGEASLCHEESRHTPRNADSQPA